MGITSFNTYNSIFNITSKNKKINHFDGSLLSKTVFLYRTYEIDQINDEICRQLSVELQLSNPKESPIILNANTATLHSIIYLTNGYKIDFSQPKTLKNF